MNGTENCVIIQNAVFGASNVNYGLYTDGGGDDDDDSVVINAAVLEAVEADRRRSFFMRGREYGSVYVNHRFTGEELKVLASYESLNYLPPDSRVQR